MVAEPDYDYMYCKKTTASPETEDRYTPPGASWTDSLKGDKQYLNSVDYETAAK